MRVSTLIIGNEIISGRTQDTNSTMVGREIIARGWDVGEVLAVGDDYGQISRGLRFLLAESDVVIVGGGLGPTADDITTAALARALNRDTWLDEGVLAQIKELFAARTLRWSDNNAKQAVFPTGATPLPNSVGSAWGYLLEEDGKHIFVIPGPPQEAQAMLEKSVLPHLEEVYGDRRLFRETLKVRVFGLPEAQLDEIIAANIAAFTDIEVGFYPHFPEILLVVGATATAEAQAKAKIATARGKIGELLGTHAFSFTGARLEEELAVALTSRRLTVATAESCSGGLLADRLTDVPGSSEYFLGGVVCYSNAEKSRMLDIPTALLRTKGAVSEDVARLMAESVRKKAVSDIGIATTGIAGPGGGTANKPVGTVFVAVSDARGTVCRQFSFRWERRRNKIITVQHALAMLWQRLAVTTSP